MDGEKTALSGKRKSGSETREKTRVMTFRVTDADGRQIDENARSEGLSRGEFLRIRGMLNSAIRGRQKKSMDREVLARLLGELNKTGSNIAQILRRVNFGDTPLSHEIRDALASYKDMREAVFDALKRRR